MANLFHTILVPHDFSAAATRALKVAVDLAASTDGRVTVLHVVTPMYSGPGFPSRAEIEWATPAEILRKRREDLTALVEGTLGPEARGVTCRVVAGDAAPAILAAAKRADAIVMATLGRTGLAHMLIGSVAEKVVRLSTIPVLTVRRLRPRPGARKKARTRRS